MSAEAVIRTATPADLPALTALRWRWAHSEKVARPDELREFGSALGQWMEEQENASVCKLAVLEGRLVGMAWLAVFERVPNPGDLHRLSGDVQSVFVVPEHRGRGLGRRLMEAICETADDLGIRKLTVDANDAALPFYNRLGFIHSHLLLQRERPGSP